MMTTDQTRQAIADAVAARTILVNAVATATTDRKRRAASRALEAAEMDVTFATRDHEMAVRASMPGATQAEIMAVALRA